MQIKIVDTMESLLFYKERWESILKEIDNDILFLDLDWIISWWKFFGDEHKLFVLVISQEKEIAGFCPLMITNRRFNNEIGFIGGREASSMDFILRDKYREEAVECVLNFLRDLKGPNIIRLHEINERNLNAALINNYLKINKIPIISQNLICYFLNIKNNDFNTYFEHRFSKETRAKMNSREKRLKLLGNLTYKRIAASEIDEIFKIHEKRWLRKMGNSSFSKGKTMEFYKELALNENMKFNVMIDVIALNGIAISFTYAIKYQEKIFCIRIAHDDDFYFFSPGELILRKQIEKCYLEKEGILCLGPGYEPYKARWTDDYEKLLTLLLPAENLQSLVIHYIKYWSKIKLIDALKRNKNIYNFRKHFLGKLKLLLSHEHILNVILKIKRAIEHKGLSAIIKKHLSGLTSKIFSYKKYLILERKLSTVELPKGDLHVRQAKIDDLIELSEIMNEASSNIIRKLINKNRCYIAIYDSKIIFYCWVDNSRIKISSKEVAIPFGNRNVQICDIFMKKKYRNDNNYRYIFSSIFNFLYNESFRSCYITLDNNKSSENEILKKIFNPKYRIFEKKLFNTIKHNLVEIK